MPPADKGEVPRQWDRRKDSSCRLTPLSRAAPRRFITESPEASLKRVGTDHLDPLMCPHGADTRRRSSRRTSSSSGRGRCGGS